MNEFDELIKEDKISIVKQKEIKKETNFLGSLILHKGQKLWELDLQTLDISIVNKTENIVDIKGIIHRKYIVKDNCWYAIAINKQNAQRKFLQKLRRFKNS